MAWLPNGQYQNLSQRVKDGTSCFLASKIPLDEDGVSNNENTDLVFKRTKRKIKSKKKRSDRKLGLSPPGTRHHLHLRSTAVLEEAEAFLQHRCLRTGGCAGRSHQNKISTIRVHAKKLKMSLVMFLIRRRRTKNLMFLINLAALNIQVKEGDSSHFPCEFKQQQKVELMGN
ncbi:hypothetical protein HID58_007665 [Brassica napus]|uniref:Uncharacterized protein n=1 Tax=Brassica napus TaxID=3708 RepID=A0ABQ8EEU7_BRANA|nr:hypothetical protein HID58_007665 [Brassica napus]